MRKRPLQSSESSDDSSHSISAAILLRKEVTSEEAISWLNDRNVTDAHVLADGYISLRAPRDVLETAQKYLGVVEIKARHQITTDE